MFAGMKTFKEGTHMRVLIVSAILFSSIAAFAGSVTVTDNTATLSQQQVDRLQANGGRWTFDLKTRFDSFANRRALDLVAHDCITSPTDVCVVIDPGHRFTSTHFGTATGVRPPDYSSIAASGNSYFKTGDWSGGIEAIANHALESAKSNSERTVQVQVVAPTPQIQVVNTTENHWLLWTLLFAAIFGTFAYWVVRRVRRQEKIAESLREERDEYLDKNVTRMTQPVTTGRTAYTPPVVQRAPATSVQPTVVVQNNSNDLLTGVLLGEALSRPSTPVVVHEHEKASFRSSSSDDGGGSSSSYSSSNDSSSSYDSGGSSSDFGSSFDGGGFDGGGGGSDF
jgi:uncharacterized membrane protein YgcG